ncbi:hypothetical protein GCM10009107_58220 [Ideonella azotifigens]|uniref:Iminophenyl-pyruvate dimer synthase domain-containing protein n=1 Tax=Ideonella azotifigens TaxID=513160 RepID=A0ABN1KJR3_9BURK
MYLSGLYSISDTGSKAYQALRSVVMEEMFHVNQAANLVVALGGQPRFTQAFAPVYPGYLPHANENTTPLLGLYRASIDVFSNVYAAIETPAPWDAPAQGDHYDTIAQLYQSLVNAIEAFPGDPFSAKTPEFRQRTDIYLGKFGGKVIEVRDKASALAGIDQIVRQGEGKVPADQPLVARQPYGAYNQYGMRSDGTYGPILGTPEELSHFMKFREVSLDLANFPPTLPATSNPRLEDFSNPEALSLAKTFNQHYSVMLRGFEKTFMRGEHDPFFGVVLNLMHEVLPNLAISLMNTPAHANGDSAVGPNAAPTWSWDEGADTRTLAHGLRQEILKAPSGSVRAAHLVRAMRGLDKLAATGAGHVL